MKVRILGLEEAFELASILDNHADKDLRPEVDALQFVTDLLNRLPPSDYIKCVAMMTKNTEEDVEKEDYATIFQAFYAGLRENQVVSLLAFYRSLSGISN